MGAATAPIIARTYTRTHTHRRTHAQDMSLLADFEHFDEDFELASSSIPHLFLSRFRRSKKRLLDFLASTPPLPSRNHFPRTTHEDHSHQPPTWRSVLLLQQPRPSTSARNRRSAKPGRASHSFSGERYAIQRVRSTTRPRTHSTPPCSHLFYVRSTRFWTLWARARDPTRGFLPFSGLLR